MQTDKAREIVAECHTCNAALAAEDCQSHHDAGHNWRTIGAVECRQCRRSYAVGSWKHGACLADGHDVRPVSR